MDPSRQAQSGIHNALFGFGGANQQNQNTPDTNVNQPQNPVHNALFGMGGSNQNQPFNPVQPLPPTVQPQIPAPIQPNIGGNQPPIPPPNQPNAPYPTQIGFVPSNPNQNSQMGFGGYPNAPGIGGGYPPQQPGYPNVPGIGGGYPQQQPGYPQSPYQPNQPGFGGGYQPQPPYQPNFGGPQPPYQQGFGGYAPQQPNAQHWNVNEYLRTIFSQIDVDRNNYLTPNELVAALAKSQPNFNFDPRTVDFVLRRYDTNRDNKISLNEFYDLYAYLNDEYATFVISDVNGNASIDANELANTLANRGKRVDINCIRFIVSRVEEMLQSRITFDIFCRVNARFDILCRQHATNNHREPIEQFLSQQFFMDFW